MLRLFDVSCHAVPRIILGIPVRLPIYSEARVVLSLDQEVPPLVTVESPWLHRKRLILVIVVSLLLVLVLEHALDGFRARE